MGQKGTPNDEFTHIISYLCCSYFAISTHRFCPLCLVQQNKGSCLVKAFSWLPFNFNNLSKLQEGLLEMNFLFAAIILIAAGIIIAALILE